MSLAMRLMQAASVAAVAAVIPDGIDIDGTNDFGRRTSDLTGNADSKTFTFSCWVFPVDTGSSETIYESGSLRFAVKVTSNNELEITARDTVPDTVLFASTALFSIPDDTFMHIVCSADAATGNKHLYMQDEDKSSDVTIFKDAAIDFTNTSHSIGRTNADGDKYKGRLAHIYLDFTFRDLSVAANRRLFTTIDSERGLIPAAGQAPLSPILYLSMGDPTTAFVNEGTGGDLTLNGVIARSGRGPNQYNASASIIDGSNFLTYSDSASNGTLSFWRQLNGITSHQFSTGSVSITNITTTQGDIVSDVYLSQTVEDVSKFIDGEGKPLYLGETGEIPSGSQPTTYLPMRADTPETNKGSLADATPTGAPFAGARGPSEFWARSAELDGSTDSFSKATALTGAADGKAFVMVFGINNDTLTGTDRTFTIATSGDVIRFSVYTSGTTLTIDGFNSAGTQILSVTVATAFTTTAWSTCLICVDLANASNREIIIDNVVTTPTWTTYTDDLIDFSETKSAIGASTAGADFTDGEIGFLWFNDAYIDFTSEANRLLFIDAFNFPVDQGTDGSDKAGLQPVVYMKFDDADLALNAGTGGDYTSDGTPTQGVDVNG